MSEWLRAQLKASLRLERASGHKHGNPQAGGLTEKPLGFTLSLASTACDARNTSKETPTMPAAKTYPQQQKESAAYNEALRKQAEERTEDGKLAPQHAAMFNGIHRVNEDARPSVDSGHAFHPNAVARLGMGAALDANAVPIGENEEAPLGHGPEDLSKSRDSKAGGLVAPETSREASVKETQAAAPEAPQGVRTETAPPAAPVKGEAPKSGEKPPVKK